MEVLSGLGLSLFDALTVESITVVPSLMVLCSIGCNTLFVPEVLPSVALIVGSELAPGDVSVRSLSNWMVVREPMVDSRN